MSTQKVTVTLMKVVDSINALNELIQVPMPARTAFSVRKVALTLDEERKVVNETINSMHKEMLGDREELTKEEIEVLNKEMKDLLDKDVEISVEKINISDLGTSNVKPATLMILDWLIVG